ncbi:formate dehydrogenase [Mesobaculum littorinae]|uniref:Formate dehydrogenase n=1 Tax=Mesobaculum littorinae TaxID=2486419 RepID=A0A438AF59_9RHOB|nr:formate dehydrogenase subunit delta [Mesobaculum littorinae]RVV97329.1 formate dehydrogenase [Mesobaculum littorinae]
MTPEKTVHMANQIATFFKTQPSMDSAERLAAHINDFWEPRMRRKLFDHVADGGEGLELLVMEAMRRDLVTPPDAPVDRPHSDHTTTRGGAPE